MCAARRELSPAEHIYLAAQVDSHCPLCGEPLFHKKEIRAYKSYEVAHVYPLNPTAAEKALLIREEKLHADPNHVDNLIPLCASCHEKFDKPRTAEEYRDLVALKRKCIARSKQQSLQTQYQLERDIESVIESLYVESIPSPDVELELSPKDIGTKLDDSMSRPTQRKVRLNVSDYFVFLRARFAELEREIPEGATLIAAQVRAYYIAQKKLGLSQQQVFINIVEWVRKRTHPDKLEAAEIIASFFIQNCEIFE